MSDGLKYCSGYGDRVARVESEKTGAAGMLDDILETLFWTAAVELGLLIDLRPSF